LKEVKTEKNLSRLTAEIDDKGNLVLEGYDLGETPEKFWGDIDYEYWRTIDKDYKDTILLWLLKERFCADSDFCQWLEEKGIPNQFFNWI